MSQTKLYQKPIKTKTNQLQADTDTWQYHYKRIVEGLDGPNQQKQSIVRKRILRYFGQFKLNSQSYFSIRNDININQPNIQLITSKLVLYGIDYMSIQRAKKYFQNYQINIRRMDDSHFIIQFINEHQCISALNKLKTIKTPHLTSPQHLLAISMNGWIELQSYYQFIFQRKLMARYFTNHDKIVNNIYGSTKKSHNIAYNQAKNKFIKQLTDTYQRKNRQKCPYHTKYKHYYKEKQQKCHQKYHKPYKHYQNPKLNCQKCFYYKTSHYQRSRQKPKIYPSYPYQFNPLLHPNHRIKQSQLKFQLYIKKRNQKQFDSSFNARIILSNIDTNSKNKSQQCNYTNIQQHDVEITGTSQKNIQNNKLFDPINTSEIDFEKFLEKLKLEDSKNDYSVFDID